MLTKFWEGFGGGLAKQWLATVLTPAFAFWFGGFVCWGLYRDGFAKLESDVRLLSAAELSMLVIILLFLLVASMAVAERMILPILRLLEGYWPLWLKYIRQPLAEWRWHRRQKEETRWQELAAEKALDAEGKLELVYLEERLRRVPEIRSRCMPTRLGNTLRASEVRPLDKYGLDAPICWSRLAMLLPDGVKAEIGTARANLDAAAQLWFWSIAFSVWTLLTPWAAALSFLGAVLAYRWMLGAAAVFGDLVEAAFDLHRNSLYHSLRWPLPAHPTTEPEDGRRLTKYLLRGPDSMTPPFAAGEKAQTGS